MNELKAFQKLVIANAQHLKGMKVGDNAPNFILPNAFGKNISLSKSLKSGPVILKFYRGEWCPICNLDLRETQKFVLQYKLFNARVLAISPQKPDNALTVTQNNNPDFEVLSDINQKVIRAYNLQFDPGEDYHQRRNLKLLNGDGSKTLPIPATYIINTDSVIVAAHVVANYTERMSPKEILRVLKS